jgi:hypothetical protein
VAPAQEQETGEAAEMAVAVAETIAAALMIEIETMEMIVAAVVTTTTAEETVEEAMTTTAEEAEEAMKTVVITMHLPPLTAGGQIWTRATTVVEAAAATVEAAAAAAVATVEMAPTATSAGFTATPNLTSVWNVPSLEGKTGKQLVSILVTTTKSPWKFRVMAHLIPLKFTLLKPSERISSATLSYAATVNQLLFKNTLFPLEKLDVI